MLRPRFVEKLVVEDTSFDPRYNVMSLSLAVLHDEPARALGDVLADAADCQDSEQTQTKENAPLLELAQYEVDDGSQQGPDMPRPVHNDVDPASHPGRQELIHCREYGRELAAHRDASQQPAYHKQIDVLAQHAEDHSRAVDQQGNLRNRRSHTMKMSLLPKK